jgi:ATP-binding cassette, subfamily B, bacterial
VVPVGLIWIGKLIIEAIEAHYRSSQALDWSYLGLLLILETGIAISSDAVARASSLLESLLGDVVGRKISIRLMRHATSLDLAQFEDPTTYDRMQRATSQVEGKIAFLVRMLDTLQDAITLTSLVATVSLFVPWLVILLAVSVLPAFVGETHFATLRYSLLFEWTPERRRLDYLRFVSASDKSAKEVKLFQLSPFLIGRYAKLSWDYYLANRRLSTKRAILGAALASVGTLGYYGAYAIIIYLTAIGYRSPGGLFTIGVLTLLAASFRQSRDLIQRILFALSGLYEQGLYTKDLFLFLGTKPQIISRPGAIPIPKPIRTGFVFDGVGFRYPGSSNWAVRDLTFVIHPNQSLGIVGDNGAGKTTIVKLLARLYDPDEGRILLDGLDLRNYDISDLWNSIAVIFQDYMRYEFLFRENIGVGLVSHINDNVRIRQAARYGHADTVAERLERGFEQQLGRQFDTGVELSGGEWQKIALSRAYMRDAQVLIFDEPTASLDARTEYDVYRRVTDLARSRISLVISHRFSTVRAADRILVLQHGELVEEGSHDALVSLDGIYAELFGLQAAGYR